MGTLFGFLAGLAILAAGGLILVLRAAQATGDPHLTLAAAELAPLPLAVLVLSVAALWRNRPHRHRRPRREGRPGAARTRRPA
jgi:uncharacterized BrkB/YihY/UPF0761 family membrane protein